MNNTDADTNAITFLYESIKDAQSTIRQLDTKSNAMLVVLTLILVNINHIAAATRYLINHEEFSWIWQSLSGLCALAWLLAVACSCRVLNASLNPARFVQTYGKAHGTFFSAGNFVTIPILSLLFGNAKPRDIPILDDHKNTIPRTSENILNELTFEQMKIVYIRDVKSMRLRWGFVFGSAVLLISAFLWVFGLAAGADAGASISISI